MVDAANIEVVGRLGRGGSAQVSKIKLRRPIPGIDADEAAVKRFDKKSHDDVCRELRIHHKLAVRGGAVNRFVPALYGTAVMHPGDPPVILMELLRGVEILQYIRDVQPRLRPNDMVVDALAIGRDTAHAYRCLSEVAVHKDISARNLFVRDLGDGGSRVVFLDFGSSRLHRDPATGPRPTTPPYNTPGDTGDGRHDEIRAVGHVLEELFARPLKLLEAASSCEVKPAIDLLRLRLKQCAHVSDARPEPSTLVQWIDEACLQLTDAGRRLRLPSRRVALGAAGFVLTLASVAFVGRCDRVTEALPSATSQKPGLAVDQPSEPPRRVRAVAPARPLWARTISERLYVGIERLYVGIEALVSDAAAAQAAVAPEVDPLAGSRRTPPSPRLPVDKPSSLVPNHATADARTKKQRLCETCPHDSPTETKKCRARMAAIPECKKNQGGSEFDDQ